MDAPQEFYVHGILGVYELNRIELLRDVYTWAYSRSCACFSVLRQVLGEPDPLRAKYRDHIAEIISQVVRQRSNRAGAVAYVKVKILEYPSVNRDDIPQLIEIIDRELLALNDGNIARYRIRLAEYQAWRAHWDAG